MIRTICFDVWMKLQKKKTRKLYKVFSVAFVRNRPVLPVATQERKPPELIVAA